MYVVLKFKIKERVSNLTTDRKTLSDFYRMMTSLKRDGANGKTDFVQNIISYCNGFVWEYSMNANPDSECNVRRTLMVEKRGNHIEIKQQMYDVNSTDVDVKRMFKDYFIDRVVRLSEGTDISPHNVIMILSLLVRKIELEMISSLKLEEGLNKLIIGDVYIEDDYLVVQVDVESLPWN